MEAMKLEIERLHLNLSAAQRDRALLALGVDPATINPNLLLDDYYIGVTCRMAQTLAVLGHASLEDKITASIGLEISEDSSIDFWNVTRIGESCLGGGCQVHAEAKATARASSTSVSPPISTFSCSECQKKVCKVCCAGKGALLLSSYNTKESSSLNGINSQGGSAHGTPADVSSNRSAALDGFICKLCCHEVVLDALLLDYVRVLISQRRGVRADDAADKAMDHVIGFSSIDSAPEKHQSSCSQQAAKRLRQLMNEEESLAEFPFASFLHTVLHWTLSLFILNIYSSTSVFFLIIHSHMYLCIGTIYNTEVYISAYYSEC